MTLNSANDKAGPRAWQGGCHEKGQGVEGRTKEIQGKAGYGLAQYG